MIHVVTVNDTVDSVWRIEQYAQERSDKINAYRAKSTGAGNYTVQPYWSRVHSFEFGEPEFLNGVDPEDKRP